MRARAGLGLGVIARQMRNNDRKMQSAGKKLNTHTAPAGDEICKFVFVSHTRGLLLFVIVARYFQTGLNGMEFNLWKFSLLWAFSGSNYERALSFYTRASSRRLRTCKLIGQCVCVDETRSSISSLIMLRINGALIKRCESMRLHTPWCGFMIMAL